MTGAIFDGCTSTGDAHCCWVGSRREFREINGGGAVIVCLRTVGVSDQERARLLTWIGEGRRVREAHAILAEWVIEPSSGEGETVTRYDVVGGYTAASLPQGVQP